MRSIALILLGGAVLVTVGCSSSRSFSRQDVMADHIASVRPDGSSYAPTNTVHARRAAPSAVTYQRATTTARYVPAPPPPPAMPAARSPQLRSVQPVQPVSRAATPAVVRRPAARIARPVRRAPVQRRAPKRSGWKLLGGCAGGT